MTAVGIGGVGKSPKNIGSEIATDLRALAEPRIHGEKINVVLDRIARACGFDYWRTFDLWYRKARRVEESERAAVAAALDKKRKEAARNELHELRTRLLRLESLLVQTDEDFHRPDITALGQQRRTLR